MYGMPKNLLSKKRSELVVNLQLSRARVVAAERSGDFEKIGRARQSEVIAISDLALYDELKSHEFEVDPIIWTVI